MPEERRPLFATAAAVAALRAATATAMNERPFRFWAAVILPDHFHWLIELPIDDADYSSRMGRIKALFAKSIPERLRPDDPITASRRRRCEQMIWQRRFWEHTIRDEQDFRTHMDYVHYNPVKHGLVRCPHAWPWSSFHRWVRAGWYDADWGCVCDGRTFVAPQFREIEQRLGE